MKLDLNCDLGEGEPLVRTRALMRWITSANVACGGHAGDARSMRACVRLAKQAGVKLGAHPGTWSRADRGRASVRISAAELELLLLQQVSALEKIAAGERVRLNHIKLHGALYHAVEADSGLARAYVHCAAQHWPQVKIYALAGGRVVSEAKRSGLPCLAEGFADRAYRADGWLVPRTEPGAVLSNVSESVLRIGDLLAGKGITARGGRRLALRIETVCVHSDSPTALRLVRALSALIR
jgi:5-oxoprolinase (ATP-hydrolysing) subunit A